MFNFKKGITLISLVITIIVMLILITVTINVAIKSNLINTAKNAKNAQAIAEEKEKVELAVQSAKLNSENFEITTPNLEKALKNEFGKDYGSLIDTDDGWNYKSKLETYCISKDGKVTIGEQLSKYIIYGNTSNLLPNEYQQVEYIESTGTQYIDTKVSNIFKISTIFKRISGSYLIGGQAINAQNETNETCIRANWYNSFYYFRYSSDYSNVLEYEKIYIDTNIKHFVSFDLQSKELIFGNNVYTVKQVGQIPTQTNHISAYIFARNLSGTPDQFGSYKLYNYMKLYAKNEIAIRNFIPCYRKSDNEIGLYDTEEGNFYTNKGEGKFLRGKIVGVGEIDANEIYSIPLKLTTTSGIQNVTVTLDSPLRKNGDKADYLDLKDQKIVRYIGEDGNILKTPIEENITIENLPEIKDITSLEVVTTIQPSKIEVF